VQAIPNKENAIGLQKCFLSYVDITDQYKPFREQYLKKMKEQLEELKKFRASIPVIIIVCVCVLTFK
jgi:hypothetical protein